MEKLESWLDRTNIPKNAEIDTHIMCAHLGLSKLAQFAQRFYNLVPRQVPKALKMGLLYHSNTELIHIKNEFSR